MTRLLYTFLLLIVSLYTFDGRQAFATLNPDGSYNTVALGIVDQNTGNTVSGGKLANLMHYETTPHGVGNTTKDPYAGYIGDYGEGMRDFYNAITGGEYGTDSISRGTYEQIYGGSLLDSNNQFVINNPANITQNNPALTMVTVSGGILVAGAILDKASKDLNELRKQMQQEGYNIHEPDNDPITTPIEDTPLKDWSESYPDHSEDMDTSIPGYTPSEETGGTTVTTPVHEQGNDDNVFTNEIFLDDKQVQSKYKHAGDFGVEGNYNKTNAENFKNAINEHLNNPNTQKIEGTYRGTEKVTHYYNPETGNNVIINSKGEFISGWELDSEQLSNLFRSGNVQ